MIYLIISICCSVIVAVLLKLAKRYKIDIPQAVTWNYLFAIGLSWFFFKPALTQLSQHTLDPLYLSLGILLPVIFWFLARSVRHIGIAKTDIAQRLSLIIPLLASYFLFGEQFSTLKITGLIIGFLAIFFTLYRKSGSGRQSAAWIYPIIVFAGFGLIDTLFKKVAQVKDIPYTSSLIIIFAIAFLISLAFMLFKYLANKRKPELVNFICGCILGFFNFSNILFYLKAHAAMSDNPSVVFAATNMGVIILGSLIGILAFKEKLNRINYYGLSLALAAIICITISRIYSI
ncbi:EamA family transporter [Pedobacter psychroterrae]|uniref:EamA/RhaT family transporter n=1 Tax=Pedobacter psychroterrae TaxID=2530453 RepID=A0A4R0NJW7_9SPHI|nr:EamA family transporter [Pedobacter psychroterrae]TCD00128.1 EamA/RhaT family transporter [Pedobacter psychroterrae]